MFDNFLIVNLRPNSRVIATSIILKNIPLECTQYIHILKQHNMIKTMSKPPGNCTFYISQNHCIFKEHSLQVYCLRKNVLANSSGKTIKKMSDTTLAVLFAKFCSVKLSTTTWKTVRNQNKCKHTSTLENMQIIYFKTQVLTISLIPPFTLCCTQGLPWQV